MKQVMTLILTLAAFPALAEEMVPAAIKCSGKTPGNNAKTVEIVQSYEGYTGTLADDSKLTLLVDGQRPEHLGYESANSLYVSPLAGEFIGLLLINEAGEPMITVENVSAGNAANKIQVMKMLLTNDENSEGLGELISLEDVSCSIDRGEF
jgi:hypothetical protein